MAFESTRNILAGILMIVTGLIFPGSIYATETPVRITTVSGGEQSEILIHVTRKSAYEIIRVDDNQILLAMKGEIDIDALKTPSDTGGIVSGISCDSAGKDTAAIVFYTRRSVRSISSVWVKNGTCLSVRFAS